MLTRPSQYTKCLCCGNVIISNGKMEVTSCSITGCPGPVLRLSEWDVILTLADAPICDLRERHNSDVQGEKP